ncbi:hypothetical protein N7478_005967 [Penicillium angulare]|uniref:uncharacterized protein n=1 Tax=Penicillium angulare TaxID=116970 RepID=UPI0025414F75|nr:uncharacterized protein N7478_005967 [Penicillium angulare]KAJ5280595.1 hypothetical protein N7478_005967 [Penicillium angulare]
MLSSPTRKRNKQTLHPKDRRQNKRQKPNKLETIRISDDVDFERDDYVGRIKRCEERIKAGYAKKTFKTKLEQLEKAKGLQVEAMKEHPGKSWGVIQRLADLEGITTYLESKKDPNGELPNVKAIMAAYESGELKWNDYATYWCQGKMIFGPSPFNWQDFGELNTKENRGDGGG